MFFFTSLKRISYLLGVLLLFNNSVCAQTNYVWTFGDQAGLDFNTDPPTPIKSSIYTLEGSASISDANGSLMFYTDGSNVYDRNHNLMPNGVNLTGLTGRDEDAYPSVTFSGAQPAVIVPFPADPDRYYIFSMVSSTGGAGAADAGKFYYSVVDMRFNSGLGDVVPERKGILIGHGMQEMMVAVPGGNCDVWLFVVEGFEHFLDQNYINVRAYNINSEGINLTPVLSKVSDARPINTVGNLAVSSDYRKLTLTTTTSLSGGGDGGNTTALFDLDQNSGVLSNRIGLNQVALYGCFSPDNSKLYLSGHGIGLLQYDLSTGNATSILNSRTEIAPYNTTTEAAMQLGPDGKIYLTVHHANYLSTIEYPNLAGSACSYIKEGIYLLPGTKCMIGFPNIVSVADPPEEIGSSNIVTAGCFADNTYLEAKDLNGWNYLWSTGDTTNYLLATEPGTYWIRYFTPCELHTDTFDVSFPHGVVPTIDMGAACAGSTNGSAFAHTYSGDTVQYAYTWLSRDLDTLSVTDTLNHVGSGTYYLHILTHTGCDTTLLVEIPELDYRVSFAVSDTLICLGEELQFNNTSDTHFTEYGWDFGNGTLSTSPSPDYIYNSSGVYEVMLFAKGPVCSDTAYQTIIVDAPVDHLSFSTNKPAICIGEKIFFQSYNTDHTTLYLEWDFGDGSFLQTENTSIHHAYDVSGTMEVELTATFRACPDLTFRDSMVVYALPVVNLGSDSSLCLNDRAIYLQNLAEVPSASYRYLWSTGDTTAILKVTDPGLYQLSIIIDSLGCTGSEQIVVKRDCYTDIPNAFTPNGDGMNDYFFPRQYLSKSVVSFGFKVFNRWGQLVFETNQTDGRGWDGRFNHKEQPEGVYIYVMDVRFVNDRQERYEGNVTLIR